VIGFPHGNSTTEIKVAECKKACEDGAVEIDMVINIGKVLGGDWDYVQAEIRAINEEALSHNAIVKVIFENDFLDSSAATLMDFSQAQTNRDYSMFHYILPFSERKALIETTVFSTKPYDEQAYEAHWNQYMADNFTGKNYQVIDIERGTIPMTVMPSTNNLGKILKIGTAAGQVKASTGYAFTRMQRDAKQKVNQLPSLIKARHLFYDSILLNMIESENKAIPLVMDRLFGRINFAKILRFLDEKTSIWDEIRTNSAQAN
jgi:hypothetical protein